MLPTGINHVSKNMKMNSVSYERKQEVAIVGYMGSQKLTNESSEISECTSAFSIKAVEMS